MNRLCGSGFEAVIQGAQRILLGEADVVLAGGTESMSQAPHVVRGARWGLRLGQSQPLEDPLWEALRDSYCGLAMAETAENLAECYGLDRAAVDAYARAEPGVRQGRVGGGPFADEVVPVVLKDRKTRQDVAWAADEHMRPDTTVEGLAKLPPYFKKDGVVTAGNASGICDGAAALVVAGEHFARERGLRPLGRLVGWGVAGVDPSVMGIGPVPASRRALAHAGLALEDMDLVEINEAFAPQYLAVEQELGLDRGAHQRRRRRHRARAPARRQRRPHHRAPAPCAAPPRRAVRPGRRLHRRRPGSGRRRGSPARLRIVSWNCCCHCCSPPSSTRS